MKQLDLVKLKNSNKYQANNLEKNMRGIVIQTHNNNANVLFPSPQNIGDFAIVNIKLTDLEKETKDLPAELKNELLQNIDGLISNPKHILEPAKIHNYDLVELLVEEEKYSKFGIHKGDVGCVMDSNAIKNCIEVDFSGIDTNGNFYGDCISVNIDDLKVIKKVK